MRRRFLILALVLPGSVVMAGEGIQVERNARGRMVATNVINGSYAAPRLERSRPQQEAASHPTSHGLGDLIRRAARDHGLSPALVQAVVAVESAFDTKAVSPKGARGLMQLMPETARSLAVTDVYDPRQNLQAGSRHLRALLDRYDGDLRLALAAYNAGQGAVERHGGIPPYPETRQYVQKVLMKYEEARSLEASRKSVVPYRDSRGRVVISNVPRATVPAAARRGQED